MPSFKSETSTHLVQYPLFSNSFLILVLLFQKVFAYLSHKFLSYNFAKYGCSAVVFIDLPEIVFNSLIGLIPWSTKAFTFLGTIFPVASSND